jgi:hypothetical protein
MKHFGVGGANSITAITSLIWLWLKWGWKLNGAICYETTERKIKYTIGGGGCSDHAIVWILLRKIK